MKPKREALLLGKLLKKLAPRIGASVLMEPKWGIAGQITFANGKHSYFRYNTLDMNPVGAADIAKDKDYANFFMRKLGYPVVPGSKTFFRKDWGEKIGAAGQDIHAGYAYALTLGMPVIVKPNSGSQGNGVALVHNKREFYQAMRAIFTNDRIAIIQSPVIGKDYRLVVLDTEVISAYERVPLSVVGDGKSSIKLLLKKKQEHFIKQKRDTQINVNDPRIVLKLRRQELSFDSIPQKDTRVFLLDNANLSTGGDSIDVTDTVSPGFKKLAIALTKDMGLRLCGVDLMVSGDIRDIPKAYWVLEINAAPGLDHYTKSGVSQAKIVETLYTKVLKHLSK